MASEGETLADIRFDGQVIEWRGPAPHYFVALPPEHVGEVHHAARLASYGWGVVPVTATADDIPFHTSLFPKDGGYLLPLKAAVRKAGGIAPGARVRIHMLVKSPRRGV